jgi:heterodisulfide reductase subunit C
MDMNICRGIDDWLYCLKCPYLCTSSCPIEREDTFRALSEIVKLGKEDNESYFKEEK